MKQYATVSVETKPKRHQRTNSSNQDVVANNINNEKSPAKTTRNKKTNFNADGNNSNISTGQNENSSSVMKCLEQSIKIIEKIQVDFEMSAKNNLMNSLPESELNRIMNEIKGSDLSQYLFLSQQKKNYMTNEILELSDLRIKNYSSAFEIINSSIGEIKDYLNILASQGINLGEHEQSGMMRSESAYSPSKESYSITPTSAACQKNIQISENNTKSQSEPQAQAQPQILLHQMSSNKLRERHSYTDQELSKLKLGRIEEHLTEVEDEQCDFSEFSMYENALVLPPKSSPFNYLDVKDIIRLRSKKFSIRNPSPQEKSKFQTLPEKIEEQRPLTSEKAAEDDEVEYIEDDLSIEGDDEPNDCEKTIDQFNIEDSEIFPKIHDVKATIESEKANHSTRITTGYESSAHTAASQENNKNNPDAKCMVF